MGTVRTKVDLGKVEQTNGTVKFDKIAEAEMLVDTGGNFSCLPADVLRKCGVVPVRSVRLRVADGRQIERPLGFAWMVVEGVMIQSPVLFGEAEDPNLLGLVALEVANLSVDPSGRRLIHESAYIHYGVSG